MFFANDNRILKDFVLVTDPVNRPLPRTPKGSMRREIAYEMYREDIERIYREAEVGLLNMDVGETWMRPPESGKDGKWDEKGVREFVKRVVQGVVGEKKKVVDPKRDLFEQGCDSPQAAYIYQVILSALVQYASSPEAKLPEHNTPEDIEDFLLKLIQNKEGDAAQREHGRRAKVEAMRDMDPHVSKVYALNRTSEKRLVERQREAFKDRGIDDCLLESQKLVLLEGNTADVKLGLEESVYDELLSTVTTVIANASVATVSGWASKKELVSERELDPEFALGTGYGESKWVAEQVLSYMLSQMLQKSIPPNSIPRIKNDLPRIEIISPVLKRSPPY
ncbi:hypothetical protein K435DRAFT_965630 [Dendrothele bispora CBS 962.96]|uniref:Thioester reductase (TE) domain-containing protein n=1 Tax=Dendrothele bispora (strain CBS 962.96) TaxID=1314807 RepID=A0A4S8M4F9_DENBC|nr:hypothetical protein K435DRAFT_965630 [Dendrothele bispora CBS 962.96]